MSKGEWLVAGLTVIGLLLLVAAFFGFIYVYYWMVAKLFGWLVAALADAIATVIRAARG